MKFRVFHMTEWNIERAPLNQNFRAEVRKFIGVEWIASSPNGLVLLNSQNALIYIGGCWITVARSILTVISMILSELFHWQTVPRYLLYEFRQMSRTPQSRVKGF